MPWKENKSFAIWGAFQTKGHTIKAKKLLSNTSTVPNPNTLTCELILNKYLDLETVRWDKLIPDEHWDEETRSDIEFEKQRNKISEEAPKWCNQDPDKESRTMPHPHIELPVPRTETSLTFEMAK